MNRDENTLLPKLENLLKYEEARLYAMRSEIKKLRGGSLYIRKKGSYISLAEYRSGREYGIGRNKDRVYKLARKELLEQQIALSDIGCRHLKKAVHSLQNARENRRLIDAKEKFEMLRLCNMSPDKIFLGDEAYNWVEAPFELNPYMPEALKYVTIKGIKMRSKSERTIGNRLEQRGILYRYEPRVVINGAVCYPDFLIRKVNGELVIWEHMGLMHRKDYYFDSMKKIERYREAGFYQHKNLICTWEKDIENMDTIDSIIDRFILH